MLIFSHRRTPPSYAYGYGRASTLSLESVLETPRTSSNGDDAKSREQRIKIYSGSAALLHVFKNTAALAWGLIAPIWCSSTIAWTSIKSFTGARSPATQCAQRPAHRFLSLCEQSDHYGSARDIHT